MMIHRNKREEIYINIILYTNAKGVIKYPLFDLHVVLFQSFILLFHSQYSILLTI